MTKAILTLDMLKTADPNYNTLYTDLQYRLRDITDLAGGVNGLKLLTGPDKLEYTDKRALLSIVEYVKNAYTAIPHQRLLDRIEDLPTRQVNRVKKIVVHYLELLAELASQED